jgi:hypothetical protein
LADLPVARRPGRPQRVPMLGEDSARVRTEFAD